MHAPTPQDVGKTHGASLPPFGQGCGGGQIDGAVSGHGDHIKIVVAVGIEQHGQSALFVGAGEGFVPHEPVERPEHQHRGLCPRAAHGVWGGLWVHVTVDEKQIFIAVEVHIAELRRPTKQRPAVDAQTTHGGAVGKETIADTFQKGVGVGGEVGAEEIGLPVAIAIGGRHAHGGLAHAIAVACQANGGPAFDPAVVLTKVSVVALRVVAHQHIQLPVTVEVEHLRVQTIRR